MKSQVPVDSVMNATTAHGITRNLPESQYNTWSGQRIAQSAEIDVSDKRMRILWENGFVLVLDVS